MNTAERWGVRHPGIGILYYDSEEKARVAAGTAGEMLPPAEGVTWASGPANAFRNGQRTGVIRWEDPPSNRSHAKGKASKWNAISAVLRGRPGEWAHVETKSNARLAAQTANCISKGVYAAMPQGQFEAVSRAVDGEARVYARYIGEASDG